MKIFVITEKLKMYFRPVALPLRNTLSYVWYHVIRFKFTFEVLLAIFSVVLFIGDLLEFNSFFGKMGSIISIIAAAYVYIKNYDNRYTTLVDIDDKYANVNPPKAWDVLTINQNSSRGERVFFNKELNDWLRSKEEIGLKRDLAYERKLKAKITKREAWQNTYKLFLRHMYRYSLYNGKQFFNERKFGISAELVAHDACVRIHKTCYYDSYLTNNIPSKRLVYNKNTLKSVVDEDISLFDTEDGRLNDYKVSLTANEPGVTTLCIMENGDIPLWVQNNMALSSCNQLVATGSGSADWKDCKNFLSKPNGFREAIIYGMERELYEESNGERDVSRKEFMDATQTLITGYFRWLAKGGKAEFVGVSRLAKDFILSPEASEVQPVCNEYERQMEVLETNSCHAKGENSPHRKPLTSRMPSVIHGRSLYELKESLASLLNIKSGDYGLECEVNNISVSCVMALYFLLELCQDYCSNRCGNRNNTLACEDCKEKPYHILFQHQE